MRLAPSESAATPLTATSTGVPAARALRSVGASSGSSAVFVNGFTADDGWEVTGLDWETGRTVSRVVFGHNNKGNGAYAMLQFLENGDLLFNSVIGPFRISLD